MEEINKLQNEIKQLEKAIARRPLPPPPKSMKDENTKMILIDLRKKITMKDKENTELKKALKDKGKELFNLKKEYDEREKEYEEEMEDYGEDRFMDLDADAMTTEDNFEELLFSLLDDDLMKHYKNYYLKNDMENIKKWLKIQKEKRNNQHHNLEFSYDDSIDEILNERYKEVFDKDRDDYEGGDDDDDEEEEISNQMKRRLKEIEEEEQREVEEYDNIWNSVVIPAMKKVGSLEVAKEAPKGKLAPAKETKPKKKKYFSEKIRKNISQKNVDILIENWKKIGDDDKRKKDFFKLSTDKFGKKVVLEILNENIGNINPFEFN